MSKQEIEVIATELLTTVTGGQSKLEAYENKQALDGCLEWAQTPGNGRAEQKVIQCNQEYVQRNWNNFAPASR